MSHHLGHDAIRSLLPLSVQILWVLGTFAAAVPECVASEPPSGDAAVTDHDGSLPGHSLYGEAFNEGPRQQAYLMEGMGNIDFPITADDDLVQRFVNQGMAQLYGFWYYEAERSFRQAAALQPNCAISYWGMALANVNNLDRSRQFIAEALKHREACSKREQLYLDAWNKFCQEKDKDGKKIAKKDRAQQYTRDLEQIVIDYPQDIEAKAILALQLWENDRSDLPVVSQIAVNTLLSEVFRANPMHPAHHFRIHLWDKQHSEMALESAAKAGPSLPGIAHMWHMPGHTYSKLHRYHDAAWQQEASARVDHAHMMRDRVMPDQIHNFAHNNEWLIRNLVKLGRVDDAISLAKNMLELPRHPKYNTLDKGSTKLGRERLLLVLSAYRLWPELIALAETIYLEPTDKAALQIERLRHLGIAHALLGQPATAIEIKTDLHARKTKHQAELDQQQPQATDSAAAADTNPSGKGSTADAKKAASNRKRRQQESEKATRELKDHIKHCDQALAAIDACLAAQTKDYVQALKQFDEAGDWDKLLKAEWLAESAEFGKALELVDKEITHNPGEVLPLALKCWIHFSAHQTEPANEAFHQLRLIASAADLETPLLARLSPVAARLGLPSAWAAEWKPATDVGDRPPLDSLGPYRWSPYQAPTPTVLDAQGVETQLKPASGRARLVFFYLGFGCLHCIEQLHAFSPRVEEFRDIGIDLSAISSESLESLQNGIKNFEKAIRIPLHSDQLLTAFKAFRCHDDFERRPLHGTFLIDATGRVRWQDIGHEPFKNVEFVLAESRRLSQFGQETAPSVASDR